MRIIIIDNYDSFTYNLLHYCEPFCEEVIVERNDQVDLERIPGFDGIIISPGPGLPNEVPILETVIRSFGNDIPVLGVCLGMQAMAIVFGGQLRNLERVQHGVRSDCSIQNDHFLFDGLPERITVGHYHSWVVDEGSLPDIFEVIATNEAGLIMGLQHRELPVCGVQFHPESVLTQYGDRMIRNWISELAKAK